MPLYRSTDEYGLFQGDALEELQQFPDQAVSCVVTSPPYFGLRDYGVHGQIGLEPSPEEYTKSLQQVFSEARRTLADDGTLWLNIGDSYNAYNGNRGTSKTGFSRNDPMPQLPKGSGLTVPSLPNKNLLGIPWRVAFALQDDGWILRNAIVWHKPNAMPESVRDRLSCRYEMLFMFSKRARYWFDLEPIKEPLVRPEAAGHNPEVGRRRGAEYTPGTGKNPGDVWSVSTKPFRGAHFATMPPELAERCVLAGCKPGGIVLDPFSGSGTTGMVALRNGRRYAGIDLNPEYLDLSIRTRLAPKESP
jgi:site-specific DNA-methyltransferase (cytosine-N4-specific)